MALAAAVKALWSASGGESNPPRSDKLNGTDSSGSPGNLRLAYNDPIARMREIEYPQLKNTVYLDHAGATIPSKSLIDAFSLSMLQNLIANPHSASTASSQFSSRAVDDVRLRVLRFFNANPDDLDLVFTANATAAIKLVGECISDAGEEEDGGLWFGYHRDAHTSLVGLREKLAKDGSATCFEDDEAVGSFFTANQMDAHDHGRNAPFRLFAYPAQSNMNGRKLPLSWIERARKAGIYTLLDAAALVPTTPLDLHNVQAAPDFIVLSFYKIFGFPDLGCLIVRKDSGHVLQRRHYFGGGTVEMVTCLKEQWHIRKQASLHEQLEDGTLPVHNIVALGCALDVHAKLYGSMLDVASHTAYLADNLYRELVELRHGNGSPVCKLYGNRFEEAFGPTIAFNIRNRHGDWESNYEVEKLASVRNIQLRTGGLCNPGGVASALDLSPWELQNNFLAGRRCGGERDIHFGKPTGVIRVSLGAMSTMDDVERFLSFMREFFVHGTGNLDMETAMAAPAYNSFRIESLTVYPVKSCAGWNIPSDIPWTVRAEGLAWDREWCLIHPVTRISLSQKKYPKMSLLRPRIDLVAGVLRIGYCGPLPPGLPAEVEVPLSVDPSVFANEVPNCSSNVCGDDVRMRTYSSTAINDYFSTILETPCILARFPPAGSAPSTRHYKPHLAQFNAIRRPILLSNESPILVISRSSVNRLNETIKGKTPPGRAASATVFRANIVLGEDAAGFEQPFVEDTWKSIKIRSDSGRAPVELDVLGSCRRCQMVCIDQTTGEKSVTGEPFATLAKTRRKDGKVWFGVHSALVGDEAMIQVGSRIEAVSAESDD